DLEVPFRVQVFPRLDLSTLEIQKPVEGALQALLKKLPLPEGFGASIGNIQVKTTAPYGVSFNASLKVFVFQLELGQVSITQRGIEMPEKITARFPFVVPIGVFALVNPGVSLYLRDAGKLDILADFTFLSKGIDYVVKVRSALTADPRKLKFTL